MEDRLFICCCREGISQSWRWHLRGKFVSVPLQQKSTQADTTCTLSYDPHWISCVFISDHLQLLCSTSVTEPIHVSVLTNYCWCSCIQYVANACIWAVAVDYAAGQFHHNLNVLNGIEFKYCAHSWWLGKVTVKSWRWFCVTVFDIKGHVSHKFSLLF